MPGPGRTEALGPLIGKALRAACHPPFTAPASVEVMALLGVLVMDESLPLRGELGNVVPLPIAGHADVDALVVRLFDQEASSLVRLARLFVDDRNAAEDLVQEGFIRLARSAHRIGP